MIFLPGILLRSVGPSVGPLFGSVLRNLGNYLPLLFFRLVLVLPFKSIVV